MKVNYRLTSNSASEICAQIKQRISIPWLWQHHNLPEAPKPGGRCRSPFYEDNNPDFYISRDGSWFKDHGEPNHKGDVIRFEMLASGCPAREAIGKLRELASLPANARSGPPEYHPSGKLRPMTLDFLERGSTGDLKRLAALRGLSLEALETASAAGVLRFATLIDGPPGEERCRAWVITDQTRYVAEARRLDGQPWAHIHDAKSWTLPHGSGGRKRWPLGILEAQNLHAIALVEGMPDFLAAFHWIWAENRSDVAPVAILGAGNSIHPVALPLFRGKRVRIFPHCETKPNKFNGFDAARAWETQLRPIGAIVDCFDCSGLTRSDGQPVSDLNDLCSVSHEQWQNEAGAIMP